MNNNEETAAQAPNTGRVIVFGLILMTLFSFCFLISLPSFCVAARYHKRTVRATAPCILQQSTAPANTLPWQDSEVRL